MHRLSELRRQRALVQEHLAWLDKEIAAEQSAPHPSATEANTPGTGDAASAALAPEAGTSRAAAAPLETSDASTDAILEQHRTPVSKLQQDVRLGCFLYFAAALAATAAGVVALYFLLRHR